MHSADAETRTSRLDDAVTVVRLLIEEPVREVLAEERDLETDEPGDDPRESTDADRPASTSPTSGGRRRLGTLTLLFGLVAVSYLVRRRDRVRETLPSRVTRRSEGGSETETDEESGVEADEGSETDDEHSDDADETEGAEPEIESVAPAESD